MRSNSYQKAFVRGIYKRAMEIGLEKEAFVGPLIAGALDLGAGALATMAGERLVGQAALRKGVLGSAAKKVHGWLNAPTFSFPGLVSQGAMWTVGPMAAAPIISPITNKLRGANREQNYEQ